MLSQYLTETPRLLGPLLLLLLHRQPAGASVIPEWVFDSRGGGRLGAVASEAMECTAIGADLLKRGGNAIDAMVGTTFCVGTIGMYHSGIGGGGFVLVRDAEGNYEAVDFRESAPAAAYEDMYRGNVNGSIYGGLAVGVPSEVRGLEYIHSKYGVLSEDLVRYMNFAIGGQERNFLVEDPEWAEDFAPNGTLVQLGDIMTRKRYADTLEKIANEGPDVFYTGPMAESMVATVQKFNGTLTTDDLRDYRVNHGPALNISYRGLDVYGIGSPAGGAVCLSILKTMEQYDADDWRRDGNLTVHRFTEAMRFAYGARVELGDPAFVKGMGSIEAAMIGEEAARNVHSRIRDHHTLPVDQYNPRNLFTSEGHGTSHIVTADKSGMAASLTTTVNLLFGAQLMDPETGIILNNEMNDFSIPNVRNEFGFEPSAANFIRPNKRPLSSITPIIAAYPDGTLYAVLGAAGGSRIISSTALTFWHLNEHAMTMPQALLEPRLHDQLIPNYVMAEYSVSNGTVQSLRERGHNITWVREGLSAVQGIRRLADGLFEVASEPRQRNSGALSV
ncbi:Gamma-glutamyltransferase-like protein 1 [Paramyrothecium foliicola]|nr:Gamma-glutamyltransferase-like protein 1 [Paramyrothecium foliicola]